jgi:acetoin utilization deacetylase AcuC-like enzyme
MSKTAIIYTPKYLDHKSGHDHPESPQRLEWIMKELHKSGLLESGKCSIVEPEPAKIEDVELVHDLDYVRLVKKVSEHGGGILDLGDTVVSAKSFDTALFAVGGAINAVNLVMEKQFQNAFALVRPPGHHAGPYYAMGFCLFNNVAIAATYLLKNFSLDRVLILDVDTHHGNGTQEIFYETDRVLYVSLHEDPMGFPGTGFVDEVGDDKGIGYTVNIPLPFRTGDQIYLETVDQIVFPIVRQYKPQFILVSAGFDGHYTDPIGELSLSTFCYVETFEKILALASQFCEGKLVAVLEGGYSQDFLGTMTAAVIAKMSDVSYSVQDKRLTVTSRIRKRAEETLNEVKNIQSSFWDFSKFSVDSDKK